MKSYPLLPQKRTDTMPQKSRIAMTKQNAKASVINRIITLFCNFIGRTFFIKCLASEYLGVGGMFGNVFAVLSLCELGFGEAVSQAMFKPLARNDMKEIGGLLHYYKGVYRYIAIVTFALCMAVLPFLHMLFPDVVKIENYRGVYLLFVASQMMSYYFAPKRSLVVSDQRVYVIMNVRTVCSFIVTASQILWLLSTHNYFGYLFLRILFQLIDGISVELYADKKYGISGSLRKHDLAEHRKNSIKKNTAALALHRIGGVINNSTDSILLSSRLGLSKMGVYSNYSLIINSLGSFIALAVSSASASVGNLGAEENPEKSEKILSVLTFANFYMLTNCAAVMLCVINPVISLWIGDEMCFSGVETAVIIAGFYMSYIRDPVQIFLRNYGVFESTKLMPIIRGLLNLVLSFVFVSRYGVAGVFAGTLISTLTVPFLAEPYMLFKHGFGSKCGGFIKKYVSYVVFSFIICAVSLFLSSFIRSGGFMGVILKSFTALCVTNAALISVFGRKDEFSRLWQMIMRKFSKRC